MEETDGDEANSSEADRDGGGERVERGEQRRQKRSRQEALGGEDGEAGTEGGQEEAVRTSGEREEEVDGEAAAEKAGNTSPRESIQFVGKTKLAGRKGQKAAETVSGREHHRDGRGKPGGYSEKRTRAPKRKREEGERREFQVVHIARAGKRAMERMAGLPTGDG